MSTIVLNRNTYAAAGNRVKISSAKKTASAAENIMPYIISGLLGMDVRINACFACSIMQGR